MIDSEPFIAGRRGVKSQGQCHSCVSKNRIFLIGHLFIALLPGVAVALQLLHGDIEQLRREYMVLFTRGVSITRKLGFSDVIMPGRTQMGHH